MIIKTEYTDTFNGEANYSWVRRATLTAPDDISRLAIMRRVKALLGMNGVRGTTADHGELIEFRPSRSNTILFVSFEHPTA